MSENVAAKDGACIGRQAQTHLHDKPNARIIPPKISESSKVHLKVISDVPYFVEDSASCLVAEEPAAKAPVDDDALEEAEIKPSEEERLREEALSVEHLACHLPKNPFCTSCNRAKLFKHHSRKRVRGSVTDDVVKICDKVIADSLIAKGRNVSFEGSSSAVISYDIATKWTEPFPTPSQDFNHVRKALLTFLGDIIPKSFHSDNAPVFKAVAESEGWCASTSTPFVSESNGVIERIIRLVIDGTRAILEAAGFSPTWWPWAIKWLLCPSKFPHSSRGVCVESAAPGWPFPWSHNSFRSISGLLATKARPNANAEV